MSESLMSRVFGQSGGEKITLTEEQTDRINASRAFLEKKAAAASRPIYGVNTGFGSLCDTLIPDDKLSDLQHNLIRSHACGAGAEIDSKIVGLMMVLKVRSLSLGHSGIRLEVVERLCNLYNSGVRPIVYSQGSLGASGDLAPLAHMSLPLIGEGEVHIGEERMTSSEALAKLGLDPLRLEMKEGLALLNGTQFMSAFGVHAISFAEKIGKWADLLGALSLEVFHGLEAPFHPSVHLSRPHAGQIDSAKRILLALDNSPFRTVEKSQVQDPYSFRCMPQVHGASHDLLDYVSKTISREIDSVSDNPLVFEEDDMVVSAGNFHGQPLALALDCLAIALSEYASISERRTYKLISGERGLPVYLAKEPGLNSGFMIPQYTAASIVSQNKQLATPSSVDSIVSSNGQEDHVSMGANAATKAYQVLQNVLQVLGIELFTAAQALDLRRPTQTSKKLELLFSEYRKSVPFLEKDEVMSAHMKASADFLKELDPDQFM
jgi:histidine ammonia-lyase